MYMTQEMQRLRVEHRALLAQIEALCALIEAAEPTDPHTLAERRARLRDTLVRHLKCEDWALYPRLKASGEDRLKRLATDFSEDWGALSDDFIAYDDHWTPARIAADWDGFRTATAAVVARLRERIEREERDLYPAVDALGEIRVGLAAHLLSRTGH